MSSKIRNGKAYEHIVFGLLTLEGFDVYPSLADDQGIDGVLRIGSSDGKAPKYFDLQVKGGRIWANIRCKTRSLNANTILLLFNASTQEMFWLTHKDVLKHFPATDSEFGDMFLKKQDLVQLREKGFHHLDNLKEKLGCPVA
jgi:hypothetical protein